MLCLFPLFPLYSVLCLIFFMFVLVFKKDEDKSIIIKVDRFFGLNLVDLVFLQQFTGEK